MQKYTRLTITDNQLFEIVYYYSILYLNYISIIIMLTDIKDSKEVLGKLNNA